MALTSHKSQNARFALDKAKLSARLAWHIETDIVHAGTEIN